MKQIEISYHRSEETDGVHHNAAVTIDGKLHVTKQLDSAIRLTAGYGLGSCCEKDAAPRGRPAFYLKGTAENVEITSEKIILK